MSTDGRIISAAGGTKKNPITAAIYQQDHFLPKVPGTGDGAHHDASHHGGKNDANRALTHSEVDMVMEQVNKLKALMKEKDLDLLKLRHENVILKQIERRQQKDIEQLGAQNEDAPRLIKGLREEVGGLKLKLKGYFTQVHADARKIRALHEQCRKLKEHEAKLESLIESKHLLEREELAKQVAEYAEKVAESERLTAETIRRSQMVEKNITNENRQLRSKFHSLETENVYLKEKMAKLDHEVKERIKEIASLSIYRYNAIHKKAEAIVCKKCTKREKEEIEQRRRQAILDKLPALVSPTVKVQSATSVIVDATLPIEKNSSEVKYSKIMLRVSNDPTFSANVREIPIPFEEEEQEQNAQKQHEQNTESTEPSSSDDRQPPAEQEPEKEDPNTTVVQILIEGLESGIYYYFQMYAGFEDVDSVPTPAVSQLVDLLPTSPPKPLLEVKTSPPSIELFVESPPDADKYSAIKHFQVFHSNDESMDQCFLIGEIDCLNIETRSEEHPNEKPSIFSFVYKNPQIGVPHYFKVAACNAMGRGAFSEVSDVGSIDIVPNRPSKPQIKKITSSSVRLQSSCEPNDGSSIDCWRLVYGKLPLDSSDSEPQATTTLYIQQSSSLSAANNELDYLITGLEAGTKYQFKLIAINQAGDSSSSENNEVNLDEMIPVANRPEVDILSPTSLVVHLPPTQMDKPVITGYRVIISKSLDLSQPIISTVRPAVEKEFCAENLETGCSYYVAVNLVGEANEDRGDVEAPAPKPLNKLGSRSLSLSQRLQNMHDGNPAYHSIEGSTQIMSEDATSANGAVEAEVVTIEKPVPSQGAGQSLKKKPHGLVPGGGVQGGKSTSSLRSGLNNGQARKRK
ncbi:Lebercilin [Chytridiales sp. JEL 0842]|nr:Lebercilin [Chytridiales sp. JEL 0842]